MIEAVGELSALWRFPVKSMGGERLETAELNQGGLLGDRGYALIDIETGKVVSAKSVKRFAGMLTCRAGFVESPLPGRELPPVRIDFPDGGSVTSDSANVDQVLSAHFHREVRLARAAPEDFTIDQYHPDIENLDPAGHRDIVIEQKLGSAFFQAAGLDSPVAVGSFFDLFPLSVLTTSTLDRLAELQSQSHFDPRRFRMNLIVETLQAGFLENSWVGQQLTIGENVRLAIAMPDPRCVMTTLAQDDLPKDNEILQTLALHNRLQIAGGGRFPCAGVYAVVSAPGTIRAGDRVTLIG